MEFSALDRFTMPLGRLFAAYSDFDTLAQLARANDVKVTRIDTETGDIVGTEWEVAFKWRGKRRDLRIRLTEFVSPKRMTFRFEARPVFAIMDMRFRRALKPGITVAQVDMTVTPRTVAARLMMQTMKLAKPKLDQRFAQRMTALAKELKHAQAGGNKLPG